MEPITMTLAWKWLVAHGIIGHAASTKGAAAATGHTAAVHAAAVHTGLTATILGTPIAASTIGGITFLNVYKKLVEDVYDQVKRGWRARPSSYEMREISRAAYDGAWAALESRGIILTHADRSEMNLLKGRVNYEFAA